jgi:hypothetical protein
MHGEHDIETPPNADPLWNAFDDQPQVPQENGHLAGRELSALQLNSDPEVKASCCSAQTAARVVQVLTTAGVFGTTAYYGISELLDSGNMTVLSLCALGNGAATASIGHLLVNPRHRKLISEFISRWSYETVLAFTQLYLNVVPDSKLQLYTLPFTWSLGCLRMKDFFQIGSLTLPQLSLSSAPPSENELLRLLGFTTRDHSSLAKLWLSGQAVTAVGLTVLNFTAHNHLAEAGDYGKIGIYQDLIAMFAGSVLGDLAARLADDRKEFLETRHAGRLTVTQTPPVPLKVLRIAKNAFYVISPIAIGALLAPQTPPNCTEDFLLKAAVGTVYGAQMLVMQREFENPRSFLHSISPVTDSPDNALASNSRNVKEIVKKHLPSTSFFAILTGYMAWAAATNLPRADYAIIVLLLTSYASYVATNRIAVTYSPDRNQRVSNEIAFRFIYSAIALSIFFQYLATKLSIGNQILDSDSTPLYVLALVTWAFWGVNVGNNRAIYSQNPVPDPLQITPPIAIQELSKTFVQNLSS